MTDPWGLSARQREVVSLLFEKGTSKNVARALGIDDSTVQAHLMRAYRTMGCSTKLQAAVLWDRFLREFESREAKAHSGDEAEVPP